ncbi:MAG: hypothetical protein K2N89_01340 [Lachnospiraceae bacterium]|nr:hypothetical protein [Lachnospiraceae bacterium]
MMQQICDRDDEHRKAVRDFYRIYNYLRKKRAFGMHWHSDMRGALLEVWEYRNDGTVRSVCRADTDDSTTCYKIAADQLRGYRKIMGIL